MDQHCHIVEFSFSIMYCNRAFSIYISFSGKMHDKEEVNDDTVTVEDIVEKKRFFLRDNTI